MTRITRRWSALMRACPRGACAIGSKYQYIIASLSKLTAAFSIQRAQALIKHKIDCNGPKRLASNAMSSNSHCGRYYAEPFFYVCFASRGKLPSDEMLAQGTCANGTYASGSRRKSFAGSGPWAVREPGSRAMHLPLSLKMDLTTMTPLSRNRHDSNAASPARVSIRVLCTLPTVQPAGGCTAALDARRTERRLLDPPPSSKHKALCELATSTTPGWAERFYHPVRLSQCQRPTVAEP